MLAAPFVAVSLLLLPQSSSLTKWLVRQYENPGRTPIARVMIDAEKAGLLRNPNHRRALKLAHGSLSGGARRLRMKRPLHSGDKVDIAIGRQIVEEREWNGGTGFSNEIGRISGRPATVYGSIRAGDADVYRLQTAEWGRLKIKLAGRGTQPLRGGELRLYNAKAYPIAEIGNSSASPALDVELPPGTYAIRVDAATRGDYSLGLAHATLPTRTLASTGTLRTQLGPTRRLFHLRVPSAGTVELRIDSAGKLDTFLRLFSSQMCFLVDVDDASWQARKDAGLRAHVPAGDYFVEITGGEQSAPANLSYRFQAAPLPTLVCSGRRNGEIRGGEEDFSVYRFALKSLQSATLSVVGSGKYPLRDSYMLVLDRDMSILGTSDDDYRGTNSTFRATLPGGTFLVAVSGFWGAPGTYTASLNCGRASVIPVSASDKKITIAAADNAATLGFSLRTPTRCEVRAVEGTIADAQLGLVNAETGIAHGYDDDFNPGKGSLIGNELEAGDWLALVKDYSGGRGTFTFALEAPLYRAGTQIFGLGAELQLVVLAVGRRSIPAAKIDPLLKGFLLLQPDAIFPMLVPTGGRYPWGNLGPGSGLLLQSLLLHTRPVRGEFSNELK